MIIVIIKRRLRKGGKKKTKIEFFILPQRSECGRNSDRIVVFFLNLRPAVPMTEIIDKDMDTSTQK